MTQPKPAEAITDKRPGENAVKERELEIKMEEEDVAGMSVVDCFPNKSMRNVNRS